MPLIKGKIMNYSSYFKYYNEQEKKQREFVENVILNSEITEYRNEKREFFKTHRYILNLLHEREAEILSSYYCLDDDESINQTKLAMRYELSRERIRQILLGSFRRFKNPISIKMLSQFDDADVKHYGSNNDDFTKDNLNKTYNRILQQKRQERFDSLGDKEKTADLLLSKMLSSNQKILNLFPEYSTNVPHHIYYGNIENILAIPKEKLSKSVTLSAVSKIYSTGLRFFDEFEYEEDWLNRCRRGIIRVGLEDIQQQFDINFENEVFEKLLNTSIDKLDISNRSYNCLVGKGFKTIRDMVKHTEDEYIETRNLGRYVFNEIQACLRSLGLEMCPAGIEPDEWIQILSKKNYSNVQSQFDCEETVEEDKNEIDSLNTAEFDKVLKTPLEKLMLTCRSYNCLKRNNLNTIEDIVLKSEKELSTLWHLGKQTLNEIVEKINSLNLQLRPNNVEVEEWVSILLQKYCQKFTNTSMEDGDKVEPAQAIAEYVPSQNLSKFNQLMQMPIEDLNLSQTTSKILISKGFKHLYDIVNESNFTFWYTLRDCVNRAHILEEVDNALCDMGLRLRPSDQKSKGWLALLRYEYELITEQTKDNTSDNKLNNTTQDIFSKVAQHNVYTDKNINQLPKKYRKNYALGSMISIETQVKQDIKDRLFTQAIRKNSKYDIKLDKSKTNILKTDTEPLTYKEILRAVSKNIESIVELDERFIAKHAYQLMIMVTANRKIDIAKRLELINFIDNIKVKSF